jgi:adenosine deaminase
MKFVKDIKNILSKIFIIMVLKLYIILDDLLVSGIDLEYEFQLAQKVFKFSIEDLKKIVLDAAEASFLDNKTKKLLIQQIKKMEK